MSILTEISEHLQYGRAKNVKECVQKAVDEGMDPSQILAEGLIAGMNIIGLKFKKNEVYVPEVLIAARAMHAGMDIIKPILVSSGVKSVGKVILGTVKGDLHDIGKNLVKMMMEGKGIDVIDLGIDVPSEKFIQAAKDEEASVIACSALLTTTMVEMKKVVSEFEASGMRNNVKIMIGGAPVTDAFCKDIGADVYTADAASAAEEAEKMLINA